MNILITSVGTATSVGLIKALRTYKHKIVGVDVNEYGYTAGSMLVDYYEKIPYANDVSYVPFLKKMIDNMRIDLLIPINDVEVYEISKNRDEINCKLLIPDKETIELCRDKYICNEKMKSIGINISTMLLEDDVSIKRILRERIGVGSKGITVYNIGRACDAPHTNQIFLQAFVEGDEYTVDVLSDVEGIPLYIVPRKRIEVKGGVATKVKIENDIQLINHVKSILENIKLPGFSNIQFIRDAEGVYWFIEINNRFSGCGAATLAVSPQYIETFLAIINDSKIDYKLNHNVKWDSVVTRYYEEVVYEQDIS